MSSSATIHRIKKTPTNPSSPKLRRLDQSEDRTSGLPSWDWPWIGRNRKSNQNRKSSSRRKSAMKRTIMWTLHGIQRLKSSPRWSIASPWTTSRMSGAVSLSWNASIQCTSPLRRARRRRQVRSIHYEFCWIVCWICWISGEEFCYQLSQPFIFKDEKTALRITRNTLVMKLPPLIPPRCVFKVDPSDPPGPLWIPFLFHRWPLLGMLASSRRPSKPTSSLDSLPTLSLDLRAGKLDLMDFNGSLWWILCRLDSGSYEGVDQSNVKLEVACDKFPPPRKVSKMLNGLGDAM